MSHGHTHEGEPHVHVTPFWTMLFVLIALVFLTITTVLTAIYVDIGALNFPLAMLIAIVKATLVFGFFMHLFYDKLINSVVVLSCLFAVALFIGLSVVDLTSRHHIDRVQQGEIAAGGSDQVVQKAIESGHAAEHDAEHGVDESTESGDGATVEEINDSSGDGSR